MHSIVHDIHPQIGRVFYYLKFCGDDSYCNNLYLDEIPFS